MAEPIAVSFEDVAYTVTTKKQGPKKILKGLTGYVPAGSFLVILGSSGAGKSRSILFCACVILIRMFR
jgi:ABC-type multidrug transport system ATPase subunit